MSFDIPARFFCALPSPDSPGLNNLIPGLCARASLLTDGLILLRYFCLDAAGVKAFQFANHIWVELIQVVPTLLAGLIFYSIF